MDANFTLQKIYTYTYKSQSFTNRYRITGRSNLKIVFALNANVFVPVLGSLSDELLHEIIALFVFQVNHLSTLRSKQVLTTNESLVLAKHNSVNTVQQAGTGAHIARTEGAVHGSSLVSTTRQTASLLKSIHFTMQNSRTFLKALVVASTKDLAVSRNQDSADRNTVFAVA